MNENKKIEMSGERFIPESNDYELELEHMERYHAALRFVEGKVVLDAACGEGYGSNILSQCAKSVIGVDIDADTVNRAREKYAHKTNLQYMQGSIADLGFIQNHSIDVVVSFETIEHVESELQMKFVEEVRRVLKPDGFLIMSSPNKKEYTDRYDFHNVFHVHELYVEEFVELLRTQFEHVELYQQYLEVASVIDRADKDESLIVYRKDREKYNPIGKYVIAIASNVALPEKSLSTVSMHLEETFLPLVEEVNVGREFKNECDNRGVELEARMKSINDKNAEIMNLQNELKLANEELERRSAELQKRMEIINEKDGNIMVLENELKLANEELERRHVELENRMNVINEKDLEIQKLKKRKFF